MSSYAAANAKEHKCNATPATARVMAEFQRALQQQQAMPRIFSEQPAEVCFTIKLRNLQKQDAYKKITKATYELLRDKYKAETRKMIDGSLV